MLLSDFYKQHSEFFNNHQDVTYPLLTKILDCNENLSVQVHPNVDYANKHNVPSKNEA
jgi:mannose-6-phosphate isomerase